MQINNVVKAIKGWTYYTNNSVELGEPDNEWSLWSRYKPNYDFDYYYLQWNIKDSFKHFPLETIIDADILERIRNGDLYLILENHHELYQGIAMAVYQDIIIKLGIPPSKVILVTWNLGVHFDMQRCAQELGLAQYRVQWFNFYDIRTKLAYDGGRDLRPLKTLSRAKWKKKFICLNRRLRPGRCMLVVLMYTRGLLDQGYVSLIRDQFTDPKRWQGVDHMLREAYGDNPELMQELDKVDDQFINSLPLTLDNPETIVVSTKEMFYAPSLDYNYLTTYFSLVTEAVYDINEQGMIITEKIYKVITLRHPFLVLAPPGYLRLMKYLGYNTFDSIIDTSYDEELDDGRRLLMVFKEAQRLSGLEGQELESWLAQAREICEFNYRVFMSNDNYLFDGQQLECLQFT